MRDSFWGGDEPGGDDPKANSTDTEAARGRPLWRDDEGTPQQKGGPSPGGEQSGTTSTSRLPSAADLWRDNEGTIGTPRPQASPPEEERSTVQTFDQSGPESVGKVGEEGDETVVITEDPKTPRRRTMRHKAPRHKAPRRPLIRHRLAEGRPRSEKSRRVAPYVITSLVLILILLVADGAYVLLRLRQSLPPVAEHLRSARKALEEGEVASAERDVSEALEAASTAVDLSRHPSFVAASFLPEIGTDVRAIAAITNVGELSARAATAAVDLANVVGFSKEGISERVYEDGRVDLEVIGQSAPLASTSEALLRQAQAVLEAADSRFDRLEEVLGRASDEIDQAHRSAMRTAALLSRLPAMLGGSEPRRYLLAFQASGEARATGGLVGVYGVLEADGGRIDLVKIGGAREIISGLTDPVEAPAWFERSYGPLFATELIQQANISPNFPVVAETLLRMYEASTGERLDGVFAIDALSLQDLLAGTGPIVGEGLDVPLGPRNAADVLLHDAYLEFTNDVDQDRYIASVIQQFWSKIREGDLDVAPMAEAIAHAVATQHLKIYSRDRKDQRVLNELGVDGSFTRFGPNVQMAFHNNYSASKVDYFLQRTVDTAVELTSDGDALVETTATLANNAPDGPASVLLGGNFVAAGVNRMMMNFLLPKQAEIESFTVEGSAVGPFSYKDAGYPVAWGLLEVGPGDTQQATVVYRIPDAVVDAGDESSFSLGLFPHATVRPDRFSLTIAVPAGARIAGGEGIKIDKSGDAAVTSGSLAEPREVTVRFEAP